MNRYSSEKKFYVYQYLRAKDSERGNIGTPYYIGKGMKNRINGAHSIGLPISDSNRCIVSENMVEADAFQLEMLLIHYYGRIDIHTGCLHNKTDGGEGSSGIIWTEERRKQRAILSRGNTFMRGKKMSKEVREKQSIAHKNMSKETKQKMSESRTGKKRKPFSDTHCANIAKSKLGNKNRLGKKLLKDQTTSS